MIEETNIYCDTNQLIEMFGRLEAAFPLKHTAVVLECHKAPNIQVDVCESGDVHVSYEPQLTSVSMYTLAGVFGYVVAMVRERLHLINPDEIAAYDVRREAARVGEVLGKTSPGFVKMLEHNLDQMMTFWYDGAIREAIITPTDTTAEPPPPPDVFQAELSPTHQQAIEREHVLSHMFGQKLTPPPINPEPGPSN